MEKMYDFVYLTNTPSFYKINLCNKISANSKLLLVLYGYGNEAVNREMDNSEKTNFDYVFLNNGDSKRRVKLLVFIRLLKLMLTIRYKKVLYSGWFSIEYNLFSFLSPKRKNVIICESSILDVTFKGFTGFLKKLIIKRMGAALPSGVPHKQLFEKIKFDGQIFCTGSVGIFNKNKCSTRNINNPYRYIYVGRLIDVKNVMWLVEQFNKNGRLLTIVGSGILESQIRRIAKDNINILGFVNNEQLGKIYQKHDIFILPSKYEPWGLVVEEALYWGLPCIVSNCVGSGIDMVKNLNTGEIFDCEDESSLQIAIDTLETNYNKYVSAVNSINWNDRDEKQVEAYYKVLKV